MTFHLTCECSCRKVSFSLGGPLRCSAGDVVSPGPQKWWKKEWSSCGESSQPFQLVLSDTVIRLSLMMPAANCWISPGSNRWENCNTTHWLELKWDNGSELWQSKVCELPQKGSWCFQWPTCNEIHTNPSSSFHPWHAHMCCHWRVPVQHTREVNWWCVAHLVWCTRYKMLA